MAATLNVLVGGLKITDYYEGGEQYEVHLRADPGYRRDAEGIAQAAVPSPKGPVRRRRPAVAANGLESSLCS